MVANGDLGSGCRTTPHLDIPIGQLWAGGSLLAAVGYTSGNGDFLASWTAGGYGFDHVLSDYIQAQSGTRSVGSEQTCGKRRVYGAGRWM